MMQCFHMKFTLTSCIRFYTEMRTRKQKNKKRNEKKKIKIKQKMEHKFKHTHSKKNVQSIYKMRVKEKLCRSFVCSFC